MKDKLTVYSPAPRPTTSRMFGKAVLATALLFSTGCDNLAFQQVAGNEVALKFRKLPLFLGGGISKEMIPPGGKVLVWPWEDLIRLTNTQRSESWGTGSGASRALAARSSDGNEVSFEVTVIYQISRKPEELRELVTSVSDTDEGIRELVVSQVRALVRQFANQLATRHFVSSDISKDLLTVEAQQDLSASATAPKIPPTPNDTKTFDSVKRDLEIKLAAALREYKLELIQLSVTNPRFVRYKGPDEADGGQEDDTYQNMLVNVQREQQAIKREAESRKTQQEERYREKEVAQKEANKIVAEAQAEAERIGAEARFMLQTKQIEKDAIEKSGEDMLKSMRAQIEAVAGKGGEALLRLDIARELTKGNASFIVLNEGGSGSNVDVRRTDTNELLKQLGLMEALRPTKPKPPTERSVGTLSPIQSTAGRTVPFVRETPLAPDPIQELTKPVTPSGTE